ncbi:MAG: tol-pal system protein YbgF [Myxococcales bacterium]|nr:tol-pal system protein YbgF [Myxococcota bacterium]MDW8281110.1 tol-pal system protein YbgF [Myxococcales bacterium]
MWRWLPGVLLLAGCAQATMGSRVRELTEEVSALRERYLEALQRQEELENRILVLTDQLESQRVAQLRRGAVDLPAVTLRPDESTSALQSAPVEFAGAARSETPERIRPLLRAEGDAFAEALPAEESERPVRTEGRRTPATQLRRTTPLTQGLTGRLRLPPLPPVEDNLGVVPLPRAPASTATAAPRPPGPASVLPPAPSDARPPPAPLEATPASASPEEPMALYRIGYEHLRGGRYAEAERDLREFVRRFPRHDYADNAQYWLAESFYARKGYKEAASSFRAVVERWPSGNKAPDALLKLGFCLLILGDQERGRAVLSQVTQHYPGTEAARLAERRLAELRENR